MEIDGQVDIPVLLGDRLCITTAEETARFVRFTPPSHFYSTLVARLQHDVAGSRARRHTQHQQETNQPEQGSKPES